MKVFDRARWQRASPYLDLMLDLPAPEREARMAQLRTTDPEVAADVEALLAQHKVLSAEKFLDTRPIVEPPEPAMAGVIVGTYRLVSPIGYGGMGSVWLAERSDGRFEGQAALKLLNAALVGRAGEARFKREGTILARLTHPHIARLIDAGVSVSGQPYLVLEHIDGRHIDRYCDEARLTIEERVRLFLDVQAAVAHAHANLIIHRDLKPSNVLVTTDGNVKLLDFGIAKLLADDTGESTARVTREGEVALTPKYAAPEQVTGGRITTATDVYALGVLLFELLSGRHPTASTAQTPAEFVKAIADTDPLKLSTAVGQQDRADDTASIAAARATTPERLRRAVRGDLDVILAKALKSNPEERYGSVVEFADDLRRFLDDQPISARRDSVAYRTARFVRRHRRGLALTGVAAAALIALITFYTVRLSTERDRARAQALKASRASEFVMSLLAGADPYRSPGADEPTMQNLLDTGAERVAQQLAGEPELQAQLLTVIGRTYDRLGYLDKARPVLEQALAVGRSMAGGDSVIVAQTLNDLGVLRRQMGDLGGAEALLRESLAARRRLLGNKDPAVAVTLVELSRALRDAGHVDEAESLAREALTIRRTVFGDEHRETATSKSDLGLLLLQRGNLSGAERLLRENVATTERLLGTMHPNTASAKASLASAMLAAGDPAGAELLLREAARVNRSVFGPDRPEYAQMLNSLAGAVEAQGRLAEAESLLDECLRIAERNFPADHPRVLTYTVNRARVHIERGRGRDTESVLRRVLAARQRLLPAGDWRIAQAQSLLGAALLAERRFDEAESLMLEADRVLSGVPGAEGNERRANRDRLVHLYTAQGRRDRANIYR
jgi:serine/threonine protein kinase/tetratricopeptide (TPR) repeat protein